MNPHSDDLVDRLKRAHEQEFIRSGEHTSMYLEAAQEIERLRNHVPGVRKFTDDPNKRERLIEILCERGVFREEIENLPTHELILLKNTNPMEPIPGVDKENA